MTNTSPHKSIRGQSTQVLREQFRTRAATYDSYTAWASDERIAAEIARPLGHLRRDARCIDVGAGTGILGTFLEKTAGKWLFADVSEAMLRRGNHKRSVVSDARLLPIKDKAMDASVARSILAYLDPDLLIAEMRRVLKDDGILVIAEKVLGDYIGPAEDWYRELQGLRNPLKGLPMETHQISAAIKASGLKLISSIEFRRTYSYPLEQWISRMDTIETAARERIRELIFNPPIIGGEKCVTIERDIIKVDTSWAVLCGRREDRQNQEARLIATVVPVRLSEGQLQIYMQERLEPVYREPEYIGKLEFPQGHVEVTETVRDAAARELREESGMDIDQILWNSAGRQYGTEGKVDWEGFNRVGLIRAQGRLNYVAAWMVAKVHDAPTRGSLDNFGRWLTIEDAVLAVEAGQVYALNAPMVQFIASESELLRNNLSLFGKAVAVDYPSRSL